MVGIDDSKGMRRMIGPELDLEVEVGSLLEEVADHRILRLRLRPFRPFLKSRLTWVSFQEGALLEEEGRMDCIRYTFITGFFRHHQHSGRTTRECC